MSDLKILIADDEHLALERLERLLNKLGFEEILKAENAYQAKKILQNHPDIDIVFLDIKMPGKDGLELAREFLNLREDLIVIIQTAYEEYALGAYQSGAIGYLIKPYTLEDLGKVINRIKSLIKLHKRILVLDKKFNLQSLSINQIYYIKADLKHSLVRTKEDFYKCIASIGELEMKLKKHGFFRIHKSFLINLSKVSKIEPKEFGKLSFYFEDINESILSSKSGAKAFREIHKI